MSTDQGWFAARIILERVFPLDPAAQRLFEERIVLLRARDDDEAWKKAERAGRSAGERYSNSAGEPVEWRFTEVLDVQSILDEEIEDGTEVYYSFLNESEVVDARRRIESPVLRESALSPGA